MNVILLPPEGDDDRDTRIAGALGELDPGRDDPTYWVRFHRDAVAVGRAELRRRRWESERSVTGVMSVWSRAVVPLALAAAALAGFYLARPVLEHESHLSVEDMLTMGLAHPIPADAGQVEVEDPEWLFTAVETAR